MSRFGLIAGRYQLRDQIGVGGMGRVWLAYDEMLGREVAIKEVAPRHELTGDESDELCRLILREARAIARINHPHVVQIYDVIQSEEWPWIVMEYVPSLSLHKVIQHEGPLPPGEVAVIGLALLGALTAAHEAGILHRDVKPDNVLIGEDGRVVLTDFGLARFDADGRVTQTGRLGTPQYVAPERARLGVSSREADLWSLGATLYAAVEGRSPYARGSIMETLTALATQEPDPMKLAGPLEPAITGLLRREPTERLSPARVEQVLQTVLRESAKPVPRSHRKRRPYRHRPALRRLSLALAMPLLAFSVAAAVAGEPPEPVRPTEIPYGVMGCDSPLTTARPRAIEASDDVPLPPGWALLPGWTYYHDPQGYSVSVPSHWLHWRGRGAACFRDPSSSRVLAIGSGPLDGQKFTTLHEKDILLDKSVLEREFTYQSDSRQRHAVALVSAEVTLLWVSDEFDFQPSRSLYDAVRGTLRMVRGP